MQGLIFFKGIPATLTCLLEELRSGRPLEQMKASPALVRALVRFVDVTGATRRNTKPDDDEIHELR